MQLKFWRRRQGRKASVSVEFALISVLFLLPLAAGALDFICIINAQAQLNTALQALLYYSWSNTSAALSNTSTTTESAEIALINAINGASTFSITLVSGTVAGSYSNLAYECVSTSTAPYTITPSASASCSSSTLETYVQFKVTTKVNLPFPLPLNLANPLTLSASGSAQVQ
jgi:Flp pilus assembly protein TadG